MKVNKNNRLSTWIFSALLLVPLIFASPLTHAHQAHCEDTKLGDLMNQMKKSYKQLRKSVKKEDFSRAEHLAEELIRLSSEAHEHSPLKMKEDTKLKLADYQTAMREMDETLNALQLSIKQQQEDAIQDHLDKLNKLKKSGHKKFRMDCD